MSVKADLFSYFIADMVGTAYSLFVEMTIIVVMQSHYYVLKVHIHPHKKLNHQGFKTMDGQ